ncbi:MAG: spore germination protein GerW family protein [Clostridia bacterium]|jgi:uncharacterized spore protein YtfJ|nr:spore germination protein GerW family protein [Clostridia bacterium]
MNPEENRHIDNEKEFNEIFENVLDGLKNSARAEMVTGPRLTVGDVTLIPLIEVSMNLGIGEKRTQRGKEYFSVGLGANIAPSSIIVIREDQIYALSLKQKNKIENTLENIRQESYNEDRKNPDNPGQ